MRLRTPYIQATLLFLSSATAVPIFGGRLSDLAILLFALTLLMCKPRKKNSIDVLTILLIITILTILVSTAFAAIIDFRKLQDGLTNAFAVPFAIVLSLACAWQLAPNQVFQIMSAYTKVIVPICLGLWLLHLYQSLPSWIIYAENFDRFSALSQNPNQLALYLLPVPFFAVISYVHGFKSKFSAFIEICLIVVINAVVLGKALFIGWGLSLVFVFTIGWIWFGNISILKIKFFARVLLSVSVFFTSIPVFFLLYTGNIAGSQEGQGGIRIQLWQNGLSAWADSIFVGHGPGHYSGLDFPFEGMESHNFLIDWVSSYGLLGGIALMAYFGWLFLFSIKHRAWIIIALYFTLIVQATFHFYGRQPMFWLLLIFGYLTTAAYANKNRGYK